MCFSSSFSPSHFCFRLASSKTVEQLWKVDLSWYIEDEALSSVSSSVVEINSSWIYGQAKKSERNNKSSWRHCGKWTIYEWKRSGCRKKNMGAGEAKRNSKKRQRLAWDIRREWHESKFIQATKFDNFPNWLRVIKSKAQKTERNKTFIRCCVISLPTQAQKNSQNIDLKLLWSRVRA